MILVHDVLKDRPMMTKFPLANFQKLTRRRKQARSRAFLAYARARGS
jgi:hypothetical protein